MAVIPVQPEPAASVLVLRPASKGFEVLMVHRQDRGVFGGIVVFPGGKVDLVDRSDLSRSAVSGDFDDQADRAAALRELAEETGLAGTTNGVVAAPNVRDEAMFSQIESRGEVLDAEAPRFEGHQPGRDSVQGRRRCRMRRQSSMVSGRASESVSQVI